MRIRAALQGRLDELYRREAKAVEQGGRRALRRAAFGIRNHLRGQLRRAFPASTRMRNLVTAKERSPSVFDVYSRGLIKGPGGLVDLVTLYSEGAVIRSRGGGWLAIPMPVAPLKSGRGGGQAMSPADMRQAGLVPFVIRGDSGKPMVAIRRGRTLEVTHVLVRAARVRKRIDIGRAEKRWLPRLPQLLAEEMDKAAASLPAGT